MICHGIVLIYRDMNFSHENYTENETTEAKDYYEYYGSVDEANLDLDHSLETSMLHKHSESVTLIMLRHYKLI